LIGSTGLGYAKDRFASNALMSENAAVYQTYKAENPSKFLFFEEVHGLDGKKLGDVQKQLSDAREALSQTGVTDPAAALGKLGPAERSVHEASIKGDRQTLVADSAIPATMACIYLCLFIYFRVIGGYKAVHILPQDAAPKPA
jgi:hypothetical protein